MAADQKPEPQAAAKPADLKRDHERAVADDLLKNLGFKLVFKRLGDDKGEPDVIYEREDGKTLGIEVSTAYYEEGDAKQEWQHARGEREMPAEGQEPRDGGVMANPDAQICGKVQKELEVKCTKKYAGTDETWLCIKQIADLSDAESVQDCIGSLKIPDKHGFAHIYLLYLVPDNEGGGSKAEQII